MNPLRRSYEARILIVPLGPGGTEITQDLSSLGVDGIQVLTEITPIEALTSPLGEGAWAPPRPASIGQLTESADMVVLVGSNLTEVPQPVVKEVCEAARQGGALVAAVLVSPQHWDQPAGASAMVTLRNEVDMLVQVRGLKLLVALLDVLRGGARAEDYPELAVELSGAST